MGLRCAGTRTWVGSWRTSRDWTTPRPPTRSSRGSPTLPAASGCLAWGTWESAPPTSPPWSPIPAAPACGRTRSSSTTGRSRRSWPPASSAQTAGQVPVGRSRDLSARVRLDHRDNVDRTTDCASSTGYPPRDTQQGGDTRALDTDRRTGLRSQVALVAPLMARLTRDPALALTAALGGPAILASFVTAQWNEGAMALAATAVAVALQTIGRAANRWHRVLNRRQ